MYTSLKNVVKGFLLLIICLSEYRYFIQPNLGVDNEPKNEWVRHQEVFSDSKGDSVGISFYYKPMPADTILVSRPDTIIAERHGFISLDEVYTDGISDAALLQKAIDHANAALLWGVVIDRDLILDEPVNIPEGDSH